MKGCGQWINWIFLLFWWCFLGKMFFWGKFLKYDNYTDAFLYIRKNSETQG